MNKAIERIKKAAQSQLPDYKKKAKVILDTDADEEKVAELLAPYGVDWETTLAKHGKWCRWDVEGKDRDGNMSRVEVKSRTYGSNYDTWIIDTYKIDKMLEKFPEDKNYFVNVYEGIYHMYDANYISKKCEKATKMARFNDGRQQLRTFYIIPKDQFIVELSTGKKGKGSRRKNTIIK